MNFNPKIVWEKWENSYEDEEYEEDEETTSYEEEEEDTGQRILLINPVDYSGQNQVDLAKLFNFWVCHCNFNINEDCVDIIENCEGVETLEIITRYRFRISVGKVFNDGDVMREINEKVLDYVNEKRCSE